jgi:hypothetical protein
MKPSHGCMLPRSGRRRTQRGNALVFALLGLILTGLTAAAVLQNKSLELKGEIGRAEASVLDKLRTAANNAILDFMLDIQAGRTLSKPSPNLPGTVVTIVPTGAGADLVWRLSPQQLAAMGYLPGNWNATTSSLNGAPYDISWRRRPGCATDTCDIEGQVVLMGPVRGPGDPPGTMDGVVIGPILTHFGVDGGVSLLTSPGRITGFDGDFWDLPNPVPGTPAGVVAVRFGTASNLMSRFVRRGDTRDPNLAGPLTVEGLSTLNGGANVKGALQVVDAEGKACVTLGPDGNVVFTCNGRLSATRAAFTDGTGNTTTVNGTEVTTTGRMTGGNLVATDSVAGQRLVLPDVAEGAVCGGSAGPIAGSEYAGLAGGGLAFCSEGRWMGINRFRQAGSACSAAEEGAAATDLANRQGLICRNGTYLRTSALLSNFVLVQTLEIQVTTGPVVVDKPLCPVSGGTTAPDPLIILTANSEDAPTEVTSTGAGASTITLAGISRYAVDNGDTWTVHLQRSSNGTVLPGLLIASVYCFYR